jgi:hypothetical protein
MTRPALVLMLDAKACASAGGRWVLRYCTCYAAVVANICHHIQHGTMPAGPHHL